MAKQSFAKRFLKTASFIAFSAFAALVILEIIVRTTGLGRLPERRPDPLLGTRLIPNAVYAQNDEGSSYGRINSLGLRDREIPYVKPKGVKRVLILGDSFMEAMQVSLDDSFSKQLQTFLGKTLQGDSVETINAGRGGMGTAEEYLWYATEGIKYSPDLVLLALYAGDDFRDNSKKLTGRAAFKPYIAFDADTFWVDASFTESRSYKLKTLFWPLLGNSVLAAEIMRRVETSKAAVMEKAENTPCPEDLGVFDLELNDDWENAYTATGDIIALLDDAAKSNSSALCIMIIPYSYQVSGAENDCVKNADLRRPNNYLRELAETRGIPFFDLTDTLEQEYLRTGGYMYGFGENLGAGHWNENGHRFAAEAMASNLAFIRLLRWL